MDFEQKAERKNKLKKRKVIGDKGIGYEHGLYYNLKNPSHFDILVSMRIEGKQIQKSKENVQFIGEARRIRSKFISELENLKEESQRGDILWSKAVEQYFKHLENLLKNNELSFSTYDDRINSLTHNTKSWGNKKLSELHTEFIREYLLNHITAKSSDSKQSILKYIRQVFSLQIMRGNKSLRFNPTIGIKFKRTSTKTIPKTMSFDEIKKLVDHATETNSQWAPVYYLAFQLGARSGELYALKWEDVNWQDKKILIRTSYCWRRETEKPTKNAEARSLPLNDSVYTYLNELKDSSLTDEVYVLPRISAWKSGRAAAILADTQRNLNITITNFHSIRSAFITHLLKQNVAPITVMEMAGHKDFKTTMVYVRAIKDGLKGSTDALTFTPTKIKNTTTDVVNFPTKLPKKDIAS